MTANELAQFYTGTPCSGASIPPGCGARAHGRAGGSGVWSAARSADSEQVWTCSSAGLASAIGPAGESTTCRQAEWAAAQEQLLGTSKYSSSLTKGLGAPNGKEENPPYTHNLPCLEGLGPKDSSALTGARKTRHSAMSLDNWATPAKSFVPPSWHLRKPSIFCFLFC